MLEIRLEKESFKFSSAHFTVFDAKTAERLHGHNYYVTAACGFNRANEKTAIAADFHTLKTAIQNECDRLDEFVLIPEKSAFVKIQPSSNETEVLFSAKRYVFPNDDVCLLPLTNITCEALANYLSERLARALNHLPDLREVRVTVEETRGQSVTAKISLGEEA